MSLADDEETLSPENVAVYNEFMWPPIKIEKVHKKIGSLVIYRIKCGTGGYGVVHKGKLLHEGKLVKVAVKLQKVASDRKSSGIEVNFYKESNTWENVCIPKMLHHMDTEEDGIIIVMERLGPSLKTLNPGRFTMKTILMIADQVISILEGFHDKGYLHRDIKPQNFVIDKTYTKIFMIDFGHCEKFLDDEGKHKKEGECFQVVGTPRYMSVHAHTGLQQSRKDDLLSFIHVLMFLYRGRLPWQDVNQEDSSQTPYAVKVCEMKQDTIPDLLTEMGSPFNDIYWQLMELAFDERPKYKDYRVLLSDFGARKGIVFDNKFDWIK
uniref:non-specific serine/threonine protein kinase n=1 Tax=Caenorhabditis tropicalis TaxID=1561998 RepID=A0A1I7T2M3_9PELO